MLTLCKCSACYKAILALLIFHLKHGKKNVSFKCQVCLQTIFYNQENGLSAVCNLELNKPDFSYFLSFPIFINMCVWSRSEPCVFF